jgi:hypothetical protein
MNTHPIVGALITLHSELVNGIPQSNGYVLNRGDGGLLASLGKVSATAASTPNGDGASIAAHVKHLSYSFSLMNRWAAGEKNPFQNADWSAAWKTTSVDANEWKELREQLRAACTAWAGNLGVPRDVDEVELTGLLGSVAHLAYHVGAIRQIDRSARGPAA